MAYIDPLTVYIVWHPDCKIGAEISKKLFSKLCRDTDSPLEHRLGIPLYFRSEKSDEGVPIGIKYHESARNVIICLIDNEMIIDRDFKDYVIHLYSQASGEARNKFIPVALSKAAYNLDIEIGKLNYINNFNTGNAEDKFTYIYFRVLHELCKVFLGTEEENPTNPAVKLFVSHSKHDDTKEEAIAFRDYINSQTQLKTFFDANDIGYGSDFAQIIEKNAGKCVIVAFLSDTYASREWCRNEIIIAKRNHCPIVVLNAIKVGERRSFPYLGNHPSRKWDGDSQAVANLALEVTLSSFYVKASLHQQSKFYGINPDFILSNYPELFSIIGIKRKLKAEQKEAGIIIYPDPPLGNEELLLLNEMDERLSFVTPLQLSSFLRYE